MPVYSLLISPKNFTTSLQ